MSKVPRCRMVLRDARQLPTLIHHLSLAGPTNDVHPMFHVSTLSIPGFPFGTHGLALLKPKQGRPRCGNHPLCGRQRPSLSMRQRGNWLDRAGLCRALASGQATSVHGSFADYDPSWLAEDRLGHECKSGARLDSAPCGFKLKGWKLGVLKCKRLKLKK